MGELPPAPFTPETLAARWDCSPDAVRALCRNGRLPCFKVGKGMYRIRQADVVRYEACGSNSIGDGGTLSGGKAEKPNAGPFVPRIVLLPSNS